MNLAQFPDFTVKAYPSNSTVVIVVGGSFVFGCICTSVVWMWLDSRRLKREAAELKAKPLRHSSGEYLENLQKRS